MQKIVYLIGAGGTKAEMSLQGIYADISMSGIGDSVLEMSKANNGAYWEMYQKLSIPSDQDIELMVSLLEDRSESQPSCFGESCNELRQLFRKYLISQITDVEVAPNIARSVLYMHSRYSADMGSDGEELIGVLTTNYDSLLDQAFAQLYGGLNCGYGFESPIYKERHDVPPLLKLHGSFNWRINNNRLEISSDFEKASCQDVINGWIPPSVYKQPKERPVYAEIWQMAANILTECDVLRIVGCSLRSEDFPLLSLIFSSQFRSINPFIIELIVPDQDACGEEWQDASNSLPVGEQAVIGGMMARLRFLGGMKYFSSLPVFRKDLYKEDNIFYCWAKMKWTEIEEKATDRQIILEEPIIEEWLKLRG